ncbi:hypothetical protein [Eoetvoesiella caeni]|uniref:Uncharacterized protein n=1 Tax=Eoetvoesiella caeni TaxID=645616 RepID=A0A366HAN0_9BURK|nr:hypothetical protein [Eoetvoesiella caeni]MCI2809366.1 hypothetical protein [Eoetvoesiella caeni]NYT54507.1 hypothetical protein [Eoetvoesiella caeni]RBP39304.1 hypothetical protein DFR37_10596 [Eoetvoesiella caeni]
MNIQKGDLVMVVKPTECCGLAVGLGAIFRVERTLSGRGNCGHCQKKLGAVSVAFGHKGTTVFPFRSLKKIDPPADGDSLPTRADIEVPA